jgi:hypothetical protein
MSKFFLKNLSHFSLHLRHFHFIKKLLNSLFVILFHYHHTKKAFFARERRVAIIIIVGLFLFSRNIHAEFTKAPNSYEDFFLLSQKKTFCTEIVTRICHFSIFIQRLFCSRDYENGEYKNKALELMAYSDRCGESISG